MVLGGLPLLNNFSLRKKTGQEISCPVFFGFLPKGSIFFLTAFFFGSDRLGGIGEFFFSHFIKRVGEALHDEFLNLENLFSCWNFVHVFPVFISRAAFWQACLHFFNDGPDDFEL